MNEAITFFIFAGITLAIGIIVCFRATATLKN